MNIRYTILGAGLWAAATVASALSLGDGKGAVALGAPVDLIFEVTPDPGSDVASSCISAALLSGSTPVGDARVRITPLPETRGRPSAVRVQAAVAVDEPVLTVTLTAGCVGKTTRTYTFLSELPSALARSTAPVDLSRLSQAPGGAADPSRSPKVAQNRQGNGLVASSGASTLSTRPPARAQNRSPARPDKRPAVVPKSGSKAPQSTTRSRLVVEPLDTWLDNPVILRTSPALLASPSDQPSAQRAESAALWKSLNVQPQDIQQDVERLNALEKDTATLRLQADRDRAAAVQLKQQLEQTELERFPAMVVYVLAGLLTLALLLAAWIWTRLRRASEEAGQAWRTSVALGHLDAESVLEAPPSTTVNDGPHSAPDRSNQALVTNIPPVVAPAPLASHPVRHTPPQPTAAAVKPAVHIVNPEELFDVQQQAEFFISVGEHQQAIEVLKKHIAEHRESSPLAYLELLRLYHALSRAEEYTQLRTQFMFSFNAQVPDFTVFHRTGLTLVDYTDALAEIEAEWTSPSVLLLLEKLLFRRTGAEAVEPFDLAAYDDLLLLLAIAQTTPASARGEPAPRKRTTPLSPPPPAALVKDLESIAANNDDLPLDLLAASLEFDFELHPALLRKSPEVTREPAAQEIDTRGLPLDVDLSEAPYITLSDLPPMPVTAPPPAGQPVGFGSDNDLVELRLELEQRKTDSK